MSNTADRDCRSDEIALFVKPLRLHSDIITSSTTNKQNKESKMDKVIINTLNSIKADLVKGKRTVKAIAAECRVFEGQVSDDLSKSIFARLSDCTSRKQFEAVFASL